MKRQRCLTSGTVFSAVEEPPCPRGSPLQGESVVRNHFIFAGQLYARVHLSVVQLGAEELLEEFMLLVTLQRRFSALRIVFSYLQVRLDRHFVKTFQTSRQNSFSFGFFQGILKLLRPLQESLF